MSQLRVLVVDDHDVVREGIRTLLARRAELQICGEATGGREAIEKIEKLRPDVVILDLSMPDLDGVEVIRHIQKTVPEIQIVVLTMYNSEKMIDEVLHAGARAYVFKADAGRDLARAIEAVSKGCYFVGPELSRGITRDDFGRVSKPASDS